MDRRIARSSRRGLGTILSVVAASRSLHVLRITSGRGRPRLDSTAWVACTFQILRARWVAVLGLGALALLPTWWLGEPDFSGPWGLAQGLGVPWVAGLLGESALLGISAHALAGRPSRPLQMVVRAIRRFPVMAAVILLRVLAVAGIVGLGLLAADRAGEYASLLLLATAIIALGVSSAFSQATAVAFCRRGGPLQALAVSAELTRDLRMTVLKAKAKLALLLILLGVAVSHVGEISPLIERLGDGLLEVLWFSAGALLTSVSYLVCSARLQRERIEVVARGISDAID